MIPTNKEILDRIEAIEELLLKLQRLIENEMNDVDEDGWFSVDNFRIIDGKIV